MLAATSGKKRASGRCRRDCSATSAPSRNATQRKPSYFGSNAQPSPDGSSLIGSASIGSSDNGIGRGIGDRGQRAGCTALGTGSFVPGAADRASVSSRSQD